MIRPVSQGPGPAERPSDGKGPSRELLSTAEEITSFATDLIEEIPISAKPTRVSISRQKTGDAKKTNDLARQIFKRFSISGG